MSILKKIVGIIGTAFTIGTGTAQATIKTTGGVLQGTDYGGTDRNLAIFSKTGATISYTGDLTISGNFTANNFNTAAGTVSTSSYTVDHLAATVAAIPTISGNFTVSGTFTATNYNSAGGTASLVITHKSASYSLSSGDCDGFHVFTNNLATAAITFTLPAASSGLAARIIQTKSYPANIVTYTTSQTITSLTIPAKTGTIVNSLSHELKFYAVSSAAWTVDSIYLKSTGNGYSFGGRCADNDSFDGTTWTSKTDLNSTRQEAAGFSYGLYGYTSGGSTGSGTCALHEQFNSTANLWAAKTATTARGGTPGAFAIDQYGYIVAGQTATGTTCQLNTQYDCIGDSWAAKTAVNNTPGRYSGGTAVSGLGYVVCGVTGSNQSANSEYDPVGNAWTTRTAAPSPARYGAPAVTSGLAYYLIYGYGTGNLQDCDEYTPANNSWVNKTDGPTPARGEGGGFNVSDIVFSIAGYATSGCQDCDGYSPSLNTWSNYNDMPASGRYDNACVSI